MNKIATLFEPSKPVNQFEALRISIASSERIRSWSSGEIKKPETINYRTFKPESDGLFCARIFGPMKDYECLCGKYKRMKYKGVVCEKCGVEVTLSRVRRERMGHIELAAPVAHIWFLKSAPSRLGLALDMSIKDVEKVLYFERYVVVEPGLTTLEPRQLLTEDEYLDAQDEFGEDSFTAMIGAEALKAVLSEISVEKEVPLLRTELETTSSQARRKQLVRKIKLFENLLKSQTRPEWMILQVLPVLPPELRPLVPLDGGRWAASDLNDFYRRVINRNNRLKRLIELRAPDIIIRNEKRMLQEAVDALFDNGRRGKPIVGAAKRPLKSLSDMLKGKHGRFRQNLLGKRVDYSGRSVIVVGPELRLHECGLPKKIALELFKPFILAKLELYGLVSSIKTAKKMIEDERPEVWDVLEEVIHEHPVLLNRAPTLHRLGIQAFEPVLIEGKAIQLHPLVCAAFNADFDGDQMAVHVPLSIEAQLEARVLMMSTNNILSPANGKPVIVPSLDIVLGLYYLTNERLNVFGDQVHLTNEDALKEGLARKELLLKDSENPHHPFDEESKTLKEIWSMLKDNRLSAHRVPLFASMSEIDFALATNSLNVQSRIKAIYEQYNEDGTRTATKVITTPGRMLLAQILPKHHKITFELVNCLLNKKVTSDIIDVIYRHCGQKETVVFCDRLMTLGFGWACHAGISFGKDDLIVPKRKPAIIAETQKKIEALEKQYLDGLITWQERYNKILDSWSVCSDRVSNLMMEGMAEGKDGEINSIYMMADSGARGSQAQIKQLAGMRGLMEKPSGEIIERPIISNFKEGLNVLEYFNSTHGARKGQADTALKTANSGYLTRRLVDVAQDCVVIEEDCGNEEYIEITPAFDGGTIIESLGDRILGRTVGVDILHPESGELIASAGSIVDENIATAIDEAEVPAVNVRSPLTCKTKRGICATCYGRDLARGSRVNVGEAVGVIAAQSIGEPGTQLTMRTFHIGGAVQGTSEQSSIDAKYSGTLDLSKARMIKDARGQWVVIGRHAKVSIKDKNNSERQITDLPYGARLSLNNGDIVEQGDKIATWDPYTLQIITECDGIARLQDLDPGIAMREEYDPDTGITNKVVVDWRGSAKNQSLKPRVELTDKAGNILKLENNTYTSYLLSIGAILSVEDGQKVPAGTVVARVPRLSARASDITGGLPRVAELFEARSRRDPVAISEINGTIRFGADNRRVQKVIVEPDDENETPREYQILKGVYITVKDGEHVQKGDQLVLGNPSPHDILRIFGPIELTKYLVNEVQSVYRLQGVKINDKHIEIIVRQMLCKMEITDPGDTLFLEGEQIDREELAELNAQLEADGKRGAVAHLVLLGITKASLQTSSFISAASFQEATRVLTEAAVSGKVDRLEGLKENVIVGRLIPAGTGAEIRRVRQLAEKRRPNLAPVAKVAKVPAKPAAEKAALSSSAG